MSENEEEAAYLSGDSTALFKALIAASADLKNPLKKETATIPGKEGKSGFSYRYAGLPDILDDVRPVLRKHGLCVIQMPATRENKVSVTTVIAHESGAQISCMLESAVGGTRSGNEGITPQSVGSAISYLRRYSLCPMLGIAAEEDDDGEAASRLARAAKPANRPADSPTFIARKAFVGLVNQLVKDGKLDRAVLDETAAKHALLCDLLGSQSVDPAAMSASEWNGASAVLGKRHGIDADGRPMAGND